MATVEVRDPAGKVVGTRELAPEVFDAEVKPALMHQVVLAGLAALRAGTHSTKTRSDVRGGGAKPWRQKGTGRARQGSIRAPQWTGGGVAHGPHPRDHAQRLPKKMKRAALRSALSARARDGRILAVDDLAFDAPRTKAAAEVLEALGVTTGKVLLVLPEPDRTTERSFRNLQHVRVAHVRSLSTYEVLAADHLVFTAGALDRVGAEASAEDGAAEEGGESP
jgi:large subunit ribosomal protein L4